MLLLQACKSYFWHLCVDLSAQMTDFYWTLFFVWFLETLKTLSWEGFDLVSVLIRGYVLYQG